MSTFADRAIQFYNNLSLDTHLPDDIKAINPYQGNELITEIIKIFHRKFFEDNSPRRLLVGINPGRLGAGVTGVPFTDTKRLSQDCGIKIEELQSHEPSSVFVYEVIQALGGPEQFYHRFFINSVCPVGFTRKNKKGNWVNCNYYDDYDLFQSLKPFLTQSLKQQISLGLDTSVCYSLGKKNAKLLQLINSQEKLFDKIIALPHPRYVVQYKFKQKADFVMQYIMALNQN